MYGCKQVRCGVVKSHFQEGCNLVKEPWDFQGWYRALALITLEMSQGSKCYVTEQQCMLVDCWEDDIVQCVLYGTHMCAGVSCDTPESSQYSCTSPPNRMCALYLCSQLYHILLVYPPEEGAISCGMTSWNISFFLESFVTHLSSGLL